MNLKKTINNINKSKENFFNLKGKSWINLDILKKNLLSKYNIKNTVNLHGHDFKVYCTITCPINDSPICYRFFKYRPNLYIIENKIPYNIQPILQLFLVS